MIVRTEVTPFAPTYTDEKLPTSEVRFAELQVVCLTNLGLPQVKRTLERLWISPTFQTDFIVNMHINPSRGRRRSPPSKLVWTIRSNYHLNNNPEGTQRISPTFWISSTFSPVIRGPSEVGFSQPTFLCSFLQSHLFQS